MKKLILLFTACMAFSACSSSKTSLTPEQFAQAQDLMVIDTIKFDTSFHSPCETSQNCAAPLVCVSEKCDVPPSLLGTPSADTPKLTIVNGEQSSQIYLEVQKDRYSQALGMMFRRAFADGWGMLFVFNQDEARSFWMKNCYIGLDMVFVRYDGTVSNVIENAAPYDASQHYRSTEPVRYVLELPVGSIKKYSISTGTKMVLPENM